MATKLGLMNLALSEIGDTRLSTTTDAVEARYVLDNHYDTVLAYCLSQGYWDFAMRRASIASSGSPAIYTYGFAKPADYVKLGLISIAATFTPSLSEFIEANSTFEANTTPIYIRYISNDTSFGLSLSTWPEWYTRYVTLELAWRISKRVNQGSEDRDKLADDRSEALKVALITNLKAGGLLK